MTKLKIGILCNKKVGSPIVLAESLHQFIKNTGQEPEIFYESKAIKRLLPASKVKKQHILWRLFKLKHYFKDKRLFNKLRQKDAIILCHTIPSVYRRFNFDIPKFKKIVKRPVAFYEVQYIGNSPTQIEKLNQNKTELINTFDYHLSITSATEIRNTSSPNWFQIGFYLKTTGLKPVPKKEFFAVVDFKRDGYEKYREEQIMALEELNIPYLSLDRFYPIDEIREIYKKASVFFIQFPEAYGLPIAECLACGSYIATPKSSWPMSWRLDEALEVHGAGKLADCFVVYENYEGLKMHLQILRDNYDVNESPQKVFQSFIDNYQDSYYGNEKELEGLYESIRRNNKEK